jgi:serine/threonine-protein kinase HipA
MSARRIVVRYHNQIVGQLATNGVETLFEYDPSWLKNGHDLAPLTLKRRSRLVRGEPEFDHLPPLFAGSLPDDYGKGIMRQWFRKTFGSTHVITPLEMLAYVGETGMGALTYHPVANTFPEKIFRPLDLRSQQKLSRAIESPGKPDDEFLEAARRAAHTVGGMHPKILCAEDIRTGQLYEDDPRVGRGFRRWIVKFPRDNSPFCNEIEYLLNRLALGAGISVPDAKLIRSANEKGREVCHFAIERFDCREDERIHFSSLAAITGRPASGLDIDYRDFFSTTLQLTRDVSKVEEAYRRMAFNVAVYNTDDHAKNHAFIYRDGGWTLSPAFDVTFRPGTPGQEAIRAMPVLGMSSGVSIAQIIRAGEIAGVGQPRRIAAEVCAAVEQVADVAKALSFDSKPLRDVIEQIQEQAHNLRPPTAKQVKKKIIAKPGGKASKPDPTPDLSV